MIWEEKEKPPRKEPSMKRILRIGRGVKVRRARAAIPRNGGGYRRTRKGNQGKTGMGAVLEERNGSHEAWGHFRRGKNRSAGTLLRGFDGRGIIKE